jgi:rare lipoprotein A
LISTLYRALLIIMLVSIAGCSTYSEWDKETAGGRYTVRQDFAPDTPPDVSNVPDASPVNLPYSRGGNRSTYEVWGKQYSVLSSHVGYTAEGTASWYGLKFHGHKTSNGEIYDIYKMSAAHKSLPIPSFAKVTNLDNGKSVIVRVNDRGPFHDNRLIDLSYAAAARLDILKRGTGRVRVEGIDATTYFKRSNVANTPVVKFPLDAKKPAVDVSGGYLQVAAFSNEKSALAVQAKLAQIEGVETTIQKLERADLTLHRVVVGPLSAGISPEILIERIESLGYSKPILIKSP